MARGDEHLGAVPGYKGTLVGQSARLWLVKSSRRYRDGRLSAGRWIAISIFGSARPHASHPSLGQHYGYSCESFRSCKALPPIRILQDECWWGPELSSSLGHTGRP
jgi:hypothetical protein